MPYRRTLHIYLVSADKDTCANYSQIWSITKIFVRTLFPRTGVHGFAFTCYARESFWRRATSVPIFISRNPASAPAYFSVLCVSFPKTGGGGGGSFTNQPVDCENSLLIFNITSRGKYTNLYLRRAVPRFRILAEGLRTLGLRTQIIIRSYVKFEHLCLILSGQCLFWKLLKLFGNFGNCAILFGKVTWH